MMFVPHRKHKPTLPVKEMALLFYMYMIFEPHREHMPPLSITGIALLFVCGLSSYLTGNTGLNGMSGG
jgi:hypothetical protein